jgi:purine nucleosidase
MTKNLKNKKIILDVDTGVDDALAIIFLCAYCSKNIIGITTCGGNTSVQKTTKNTLAVLSLINKKIPVYSGSAKPLAKKSYVYAEYYHGSDGLGDTNLKTKLKPAKISAVDFLIQSAKKYQKNLIIIGTAPATNIAKAILKDKSFKKRLPQIYLMGGAINVLGNETPETETNFFQDPEAVQIIIKNFSGVRIIPLDVTNKTLITLADLKKIKKCNRVQRFANQLIINWFKIFGHRRQRQFELYDPLAVSAVFNNYLSFKKANIDIDIKNKRGRVVKGAYPISYAYRVRAADFKKIFIKTINNYC